MSGHRLLTYSNQLRDIQITLEVYELTRHRGYQQGEQRDQRASSQTAIRRSQMLL